MKVKEENESRKENIKIHFEFFILISSCRKDGASSWHEPRLLLSVGSSTSRRKTIECTKEKWI
jgi:hypothetical protein